MTVWPSGLRRQFKALVRKGVGSNPTAVIFFFLATPEPAERRPTEGPSQEFKLVEEGLDGDSTFPRPLPLR